VMFAIAAGGTDLAYLGSWRVPNLAKSPYAVSLDFMLHRSPESMLQRISREVKSTGMEVLFDKSRRTIELRVPSVCSMPTTHGVWILPGDGGWADVALVSSARFNDDHQTQERLLHAHRQTFPRASAPSYLILESNRKVQGDQDSQFDMSWMGVMETIASSMLEEHCEQPHESSPAAFAMEVQGSVFSFRDLDRDASRSSSTQHEQSVCGDKHVILKQMEQCACPKCVM